MKIIKLSTPLEVYAKSLFKNTIGNDLGQIHKCKLLSLNSKSKADTFSKSDTIPKNLIN